MLFLLRIMIVVILLVCVFDIYLTVKYHDSILTMEQNPVAGWFISTRYAVVSRFTDDLSRQHQIVHHSVDVSALVLLKTLGLLAGSTLLQHIANHCRRNISIPVISSVFLFQIGLFFYLVM